MKHCVLILLLLLAVNNPQAQTVYITPSGTKYHKGDCRMVKNVSQAITIQQAIEKGKGPCSFCKPPVITGTTIDKSNKPRGTAKETYQCKGITKKGARCKHRTRIANGYCYQHDPERKKGGK